MSDAARFLRFITIFVSALLITIAGFIWFIDPYWIYKSPDIKGINAIKPEFATHLHMSKAWAVYDRKPEAVILGNSRSEYGLDPKHPGWKTDQVYNLALSDANIYEVFRYFQHAQGIRKQKQVVLGVEFLMFNTFNRTKSSFNEARLSVDSIGRKNPAFPTFERSQLLFSLDALLAGIKTVIRQSRPVTRFSKTRYLANGQRNWYRNAAKIRDLGGHRKVFRATEKAFLERMWFKPPEKDYRFYDPVTGQSTFDDFRRLLELAYRDNVDLRIIISPSHARLWESLSVAGLWPKFEQWKRQLVMVNEQAASDLGLSAFPLWDFSGYNSFTTEPVPINGDKTTEMEWYWESSHYKKFLGDYVLDRIFDYRDPERAMPDDFGRLLTSKNIDQHLNSVRSKQQKYRAENQHEYDEIKEINAAAANWREQGHSGHIPAL